MPSQPDPGVTRKLTAEQRFDAVCAAFDIEQNGDGDQAYARCPVHEDKDAAMTINIGNDGYPVFYCQVCGGEDGWERALGAILISRSVPVEALRPSMRPTPTSGAPTGRSAARAPDATATKPPSVRQLARWIEEMHPDRLYALADDRGLPLEVLCRAGVGWKVNQQGGRYVLPVEDVLTGALVDLKLYDPTKPKKERMKNREGGTAGRLYAPGGFNPHRLVVLTAGEWDWMAGCALGLNVVGVTGGEGTVPAPELLEPLRGCDVTTLFDNDKAGRDGAQKWAAALGPIAASVRIAYWGSDAAPKYDLRDWFTEGRTAEELAEVLDRATPAGQVEEEQKVSQRVADLWITERSKRRFRAELIAERNAIGFPYRIDGATWALDIPPVPPALWGRGSEVLWMAGEGLMVAGSDGTGKTTLMQRLALARAGIASDSLLGFPVAPAKGRILYLAMDRPAQARRSLGRMFPEEHHDEVREVLAGKLLISQGPLPINVLESPQALADWIEVTYGVGVVEDVVVDSYKDLAPGLSDDAVGAGVNSAIQEVVKRGMNWLGSHHQRKATTGNSDPKELEDVYGSRWLTAGLGSVLMMVGRTGQDSVEMRHLKPPMDVVPPMLVRLVRSTGQLLRVEAQLEVLDFLDQRGKDGASLSEILMAVYGSTDRAFRGRLERKLPRMAEDGDIAIRKAVKGGSKGTTPARYWATQHAPRQGS